MSNLLSTLQQECADRLAADPFFAFIPVFTERIKDIASEVERALGPANSQGGKNGVCCILITPTANVNFENVFGPYFDDIKIVVRVLENVPTNQGDNGTQIPALDVAQAVAASLHHFFPVSANSPVTAQKPTIALGNDPNHLSYDVFFRVQGGITTPLPQLGVPASINNAGAYTLASDTPGAAVFYTLDGTNPIPRTGTLFTAPFTPAVGLTLKARAWLAGYLASETATITT